MKKYFFVFLFWSIHFATGQVRVVEDSLFSPSLNKTMKYYAVLPNGYARTHDRYATVFLLHGFSGNYTNYINLTELVQYAKRYKYIFIAPDAQNGWYANSPTKPDANYEDYIIKDVIPSVDKKYRTLQSKFHRAVIGLSMGGYGSAKFGIKYPGMFFFAGCLSPAVQFPYGMLDTAVMGHRSKESIESIQTMFGYPKNERWDENDVYTLLEKSNVKSLPYFYLSVGSQDGITEIINHTHFFTAALRKKGASFEMHEIAGAHDWKLWNGELEIVLQRITELLHKKR